MTTTQNHRRQTKQRSIILEVVEHAHTHPTAEEVLRLARLVHPSLSLATVYRNLQLLADEGKIRRVQFAGDVARYDGKLEAHEHFCCVQCDAVYDIPATLPTAVIREVEHATHGQIHQYALHYHGTCAKCLAASGAAGTARS